MNRKKNIIFIMLALFVLGMSTTVLAGTSTLNIEAWPLPGASNDGKSCAELAAIYADPGTTWTEFKLEDATLTNGNHSDGTLGVNITLSGSPGGSFDWTSTIGVDAIVVKDGNEGANFYVYDGKTAPAPGTWRDSEETDDDDLTTPNNGAKDISHISFCYDPEPQIDIEKTTNGHDADTVPGPTIPVGDPVTWKYVIKNTGDVQLNYVKVWDDKLGLVTCPKTTLAPDEEMACMANGTAQAGQYQNIGNTEGKSKSGQIVSDSDPSHYFGQKPQTGKIIIEKQTDPDNAPDSFTFSGDAAGAITDGEQIVVGNLLPGTYTSQETVPTGWNLTSIVCDDDNSTVSLADFRANFQLEAGETVKCTFTNTKEPEPGNVEITKMQRLDESDPWIFEPLVVEPGDTIFYQLTVDNLSPTIDELTIIDDLDETIMTYVAGSLGTVGSTPPGTGNYDGDLLTYIWDFTTIPVPDELIISFAITVNELAQPGDQIVNWAWVEIQNTEVARSNEVRAEVVPEPATIFFLGLGLVGIFALVRRRQSQRK